MGKISPTWESIDSAARISHCLGSLTAFCKIIIPKALVIPTLFCAHEESWQKRLGEEMNKRLVVSQESLWLQSCQVFHNVCLERGHSSFPLSLVHFYWYFAETKLTSVHIKIGWEVFHWNPLCTVFLGIAASITFPVHNNFLTSKFLSS